MSALPRIVFSLLLIQGLAYCCKEVTDNCFRGQFGYDDVDYLSLRLHVDVITANRSTEVDQFCRNYEQLQICVRENIFSCRAEDPIWKKWTATELLNNSLCSPNSKQKLSLYKNCIADADVHNNTIHCKSYVSSDLSSYEGYQEFEFCMKNVVSSVCSNVISDWLNQHFESSYFAQSCTMLPEQGCAETNPEVVKEERICESSYNSGLLSFDMSILCSLIDEYVQCVVNAVIRYCGVEEARRAKPQIVQKRSDMMGLFGCSLGNIVIDGPTSRREVSCIQSGSCQLLDNPLCHSLPYHTAMFPNSLGHQSLEAAEEALMNDFPVTDQQHCADNSSCFLCSLYFPVCADIKEPVRPCRSFCHAMKQSCGGNWNTTVQCETLPEGDFCLSQAQCAHYGKPPEIPPKTTAATTATTTAATTAAATTATTSSMTTIYVVIIISVCAVILISLIVVFLIVRRQQVTTTNIIYNHELDNDDSASSHYDVIRDDHFNKDNTEHREMSQITV